ncbi:MAG TPA: sigma-70 family RNA polymerase sigma factor [Steroidobacteraceae bacterium]|nr:sigma-70 family RNA polymerase sigma factor [Steroidobacteraceae bacterium]
MRGTPDTDFETLAAAHLESAYNLARWLVRDPALADDVVQDAMLRALKYFPGFRGENPRGWVLQIVRNVALTRLKGTVSSKATTSVATDELEAETRSMPTDTRHEPEATLMREDDERLVQTLLARLPVELRECVILREIEELSYKEIARVVDAPIGTVMSRLWRGRKLLAEAAGALEHT